MKALMTRPGERLHFAMERSTYFIDGKIHELSTGPSIPLQNVSSPGRVSFLIIIFHHFSGEKLALQHGNFMASSDP